MESAKFALFLLLALAPALLLREYARSLAADRLGDPTPRRWGRLSLSPKRVIDPFGSGILPALILLLWASGAPYHPPPFAYARPPALDPSYLKNRDRDTTIISLAGPLTNLGIAVVAGILMRFGFTGDLRELVFAFLYVNLVMFVFHLMPIPGLDGARILARFLPPRVREAYSNLDQWIHAFMLLIFFLLANPMLSIVNGLAGGVCRVVAGSLNCPLL